MGDDGAMAIHITGDIPNASGLEQECGVERAPRLALRCIGVLAPTSPGQGPLERTGTPCRGERTKQSFADGRLNQRRGERRRALRRAKTHR